MNFESPRALAYRTPLEDSLIELSVESVAVVEHILEQGGLFTPADI